jgi:hypothetical protein
LERIDRRRYSAREGWPDNRATNGVVVGGVVMISWKPERRKHAKDHFNTLLTAESIEHIRGDNGNFHFQVSRFRIQLKT